MSNAVVDGNWIYSYSKGFSCIESGGFGGVTAPLTGAMYVHNHCYNLAESDNSGAYSFPNSNDLQFMDNYYDGAGYRSSICGVEFAPGDRQSAIGNHILNIALSSPDAICKNGGGAGFVAVGNELAGTLQIYAQGDGTYPGSIHDSTIIGNYIYGSFAGSAGILVESNGAPGHADRTLIDGNTIVGTGAAHSAGIGTQAWGNGSTTDSTTVSNNKIYKTDWLFLASGGSNTVLSNNMGVAVTTETQFGLYTGVISRTNVGYPAVTAQK
jgi:hypothetical protein